ncbi:uncharacterized protein LOC118460744 isoform X1 [Anopheles albimanus]|uniref:uncharacterized protein LOC118460744 isoform X1 n=2 Tax=Anopheles albimanus TaxID=7167 RepID=UPI00163E93F3|nr:uncharacterized protein LOC118460744 isoform X1 [Anopheles albimanus]XP_035781205.1 uncharacterized protein LOC118460744 isoform X1 [Anopheles albimanus]XP_035781206.1 uncharacterized protein LOC118460744 isoform X1 [Anopheles albimanus]
MDTSSLLNMNLALNVARKCRICGMDILDLSCAFSIFGSDRLDHKLERYLRLNIQADDLMPKCICGSCYLKLESIDQFALMANRTEEAFRTWIRRLRGLNCPDDSVQNVNLVLPLFRPQQTAYVNDCTTEQKIHVRSFQSKETKEQPHQPYYTPNLPQTGSSGQANPPETTVISYSDLKLGLLIKDQELLKLILKALKWAENDRRASFEVLIQRLKNSSFREILSNHHLLNDSDLTQLLKSYIGQGVLNIFSASSPSTTINNNNVPPLVLSSSIVSQTTGSGVPLTNEILGGINRVKLPVAPSNTTPLTAQCTIPNRSSGTGFKIDETSVSEQMEVGVDPDLYFPYEDEDSSSVNKFDHRFDERQDNTVTIKLVPTSGDPAECRKMIPAILNVRSSNRFQCSMCPECFPSNNDLQQHTVLRHLPTAHSTVMTEHGKPAIKIRVRKNKATTLPSDRPLPKLSSITSTVSTTLPELPPVNESVPIAPLKIPASTTITVVPACTKSPNRPTPPGSGMITTNPSTTKVRKRLVEPLPKVELIRKSKRKPVPKVKHSPSPIPSDKKTNRNVRKPNEPEIVAGTKISRRRRTPSAFCTVCRTKLAATETIRQHMEQQHSRFECENCGRTFKSKLNLARHQQQHKATMNVHSKDGTSVPQTQRSSKEKKPEGSQLHNCTQCNKAFRKAVHLKVHLLNHNNGEAKRVAEPKVTIAKEATVLRRRTILGDAKAGSSNTTPVGGRTKRKSKLTKK